MSPSDWDSVLLRPAMLSPPSVDLSRSVEGVQLDERVRTVDDLVAALTSSSDIYRHPPSAPQARAIPLHVNVDFGRINGHLFVPNNFKPNKQYPLILYIYAGPHMMCVMNNYSPIFQFRLMLLAELCDSCVLQVDGRGSANRGKTWEGHVMLQMGCCEFEDQLVVLRRVQERFSFIDRSQTAILGWSYGGYMALMGLAQYGHVFRAAVAGAPVFDWQLYDCAFTERYMGLPGDEPSAYERGSVAYWVGQLPSEPGRLLVVHGVIDENVHLAHSLGFIQELVRAGKPYQLLVYPLERHGVQHLNASQHYYATVAGFLRQQFFSERKST